MSKLRFSVFIIFIFITLSLPVLSCPPSVGPSLNIKDTIVYSEEFSFYSADVHAVNFSGTPINYTEITHIMKSNDTRKYFNCSDGYDYLKIYINDEELSKTALETLKIEGRGSPGGTIIILYRYPSINYSAYGYDQSQLNNSNMKIFLDNTLVREYTLEYRPGITYHCSPQSQSNSILRFFDSMWLAIKKLFSWK